MEEERSGKIVSAEEVITKLKDEGDFDKLRLKAIRKLKENEEMRNNIISAVKQSAALNRVGAENLKPRQLSDAIYEEIRNRVMDQISGALWEVIRSTDGMKSEISETVQSVYNRILNPNGKEVMDDLPSSPLDPTLTDKVVSNNCSLTISPCGREENLSDSEPNEPPGFSMCNYQQTNNSLEEHKEETQQLLMPHDHGLGVEQKEEIHCQPGVSPSNNDPDLPPGFDTFVDCEKPCDGSDEDPDVPPGFG